MSSLQMHLEVACNIQRTANTASINNKITRYTFIADVGYRLLSTPSSGISCRVRPSAASFFLPVSHWPYTYSSHTKPLYHCRCLFSQTFLKQIPLKLYTYFLLTKETKDITSINQNSRIKRKYFLLFRSLFYNRLRQYLDGLLLGR